MPVTVGFVSERCDKMSKDDLELTDREKELSDTPSTSNLTQSINGFSGDTYNHSIHMAFEWMDEVNADKQDPRIIELLCYFKQEHKAKSILVSYKTKPKGLKDA